MVSNVRALVLAALAPFLVSCSEAPAETPADEPEWFDLDTGKTCASARVACAPGNCAANIDNSCGAPVTCQLRIECLCRTWTGYEGPATSKSEDTIPSGQLGGIRTQVVCNDGEVLQTLARTVSCF
jgi:hypothetical protein